MEIALIGGDFQIPCDDPLALEVFMQVGEELKPDILVVNGDWIEWRYLSTHYTPRPTKEAAERFCRSVAGETKTAKEKLATLVKRVKPKKRRVFNEGNHEWRLFRALSQVPQVLELLEMEDVAKALSVEAILGLKELEFEYSGEYPSGTWLFKRQSQNNVFVHHSYTTRKKAGYAAHSEIDTRLCSTITGHGERLACVWRRGLERRLFAVEGGNLSILGEPVRGAGIYGSIPFNQPEFMDRQQGFVVVYLDGNDIIPVPVPIHHGKAIFNGRVYKA